MSIWYNILKRTIWKKEERDEQHLPRNQANSQYYYIYYYYFSKTGISSTFQCTKQTCRIRDFYFQTLDTIYFLFSPIIIVRFRLIIDCSPPFFPRTAHPPTYPLTHPRTHPPPTHKVDLNVFSFPVTGKCLYHQIVLIIIAIYSTMPKLWQLFWIFHTLPFIWVMGKHLLHCFVWSDSNENYIRGKLIKFGV